MIRFYGVVVLLALAGCSAVPGVQVESQCTKYGRGSYECQIEQYEKAGH